MISSLKFKSGFPLKLLGVGKKTFSFKAGLNVLWGPNGCGKTTMLRTLAAYGFIKTGGWSALQEPLSLRCLAIHGDGKFTLPGALSNLAPGKVEAAMKWDRVPIFFANGMDDVRGAGYLFDDATDSPDGMTDMMAQISQLTGHASSGQARMGKLNQMLGLLDATPDFKKIKFQANLNSTWRECFEMQAAFLSKRPDNGRVTVLLDEPERGLQLSYQLGFWRNFIGTLATRCQVVVATHSPFALVRDEANWINFSDCDLPDLRASISSHFNSHES